jgi:hypothetical protein
MNELEPIIFDEQINLPLPILKASILRLSNDVLPKHFFYTSHRFNTSLRVCNGSNKPISKIFNIDNVFDK